MPRIRSCQLSKPAASSVPPTFCAMYSLTRARLTTHSRSTADCTCWKSTSHRRPVARRHAARQDHAHQLVVEVILDLDQRRRDIHQRGFGGPGPSRRSCSRGATISPCTRARCSPRPSTPSVSPILRSSSTCERQLVGRGAAAAHVDIEHILDLGQILADGRGHGLHQLDRGRGKVLAFLLDALVDRQQVAEAERGAHRRDARAAAAWRAPRNRADCSAARPADAAHSAAHPLHTAA